MAELWDYIMTWPTTGRVALLLSIVRILWLFSGRLLIRILSIVPFFLRYILLAFYRIVDFPLGILHSKLAGLFGQMDKA